MNLSTKYLIRFKVFFGHPMYLPPYAVAHDTWCDGVVFHSSARSHHILQSDGETASFPLPPLDKYMPDLAATVGRSIPTSWGKGFAADHCLWLWRGLNVNLQARRVLTDPIAFLSRNGGFCPVSLHYAFPSIFRALCLLPLSSFLSFCP